MEMTRCTAAILLMLSLGALVTAEVTGGDGVDTIRLPSNGLADEFATEAAAATPCCDLLRCTRSFPPICHCMDKMSKCPKTCKLCQTDEASSLVVCLDQYDAKQGQACTPAAPPPPAEPERPWKCCDLARCTRSFPPSCQCQDKVKECAATCQVCKKDDASSSYVCLDSYTGKIGPTCTPAAPPPPAEQERPWECCDLARCTRSFPPTCQCMDEVKTCAKTCKSCEKVKASSRYVCLDQYRGKQGPACTTGAPPPPTFTPRGN